MEPKGFFASLFDMSFNEFITIKIIKFLFILAIIGAAFFSISMLFTPGMFFLFRLLLAPIAFILWVLLARIWMELVIVAFRIAENTNKLVQLKSAEPPPAS